jgi:peptidyl-prolyl cis-trans isomerase B (cyclophilin B)
MKLNRMALVSLVLASLLALAYCGSSTSPESEAPESAAKAPAEESAAKKAAEEEEEVPEITGTPVVVLETTKGTIKIELYPDKAPKTVANFLSYVDRKFYDYTIFHRVIKNYVIQAGAFSYQMGRMKKKWPRQPIENEADNGLKNVRGAVAAARGAEEPNSASSQFFINLRNNKMLDKGHPKGDGFGYCVFGKVIEGIEAADAISRQPTETKGSRKNVPTVPMFISSARRES